MARQRLKLGLRRVLLGQKICNQPFQKFTAGLSRRRLLALWGLRRYISVEFPDIASSGALARAGGFGPVSKGF